MKLVSTLMGAALMVGSVGGVAQAAELPREIPSVSQEVIVVRFAPPPPRYEYYGPAPSSRHFWVRGHWHWSGREYVWVGGHWDLRRDGRTWVHSHWDNVNGQWRFVPGHWA